MKNTGQCVKCNSEDVIRISQGWSKATTYANVIVTGWTAISAVKVVRYLCGSCGYSEEWIDDKESIEKLRKKFGSPTHR